MMKFKKFLIFICLIVCLFSIASVCASDINDTVVANDDQSDEVISIENQDNNEVSVNEEDVLSEDAGTFSDLANAIKDADDELILTKNYTYSTGDLSFKDYGITIDKEITIDGNGFTINGNNQARAFNIVSTNVILKNITFMNCKNNNNGGAIHWSGSNGVVSGCSFVNNSANYGGAILVMDSQIYGSGCNGVVSGCSFVNNSAINDGGAILWQAVNGTVSGCTFTNNSAKKDGGAIYWYNSNCAVNYCIFIGNGKNTVYSKIDYDCNYNWWGSNNPDLNNLINKKPTYWVIANLICNGYEYIVRLNQINTTNGEISDFDNETKLPVHNVTYTFSDGKVIIAPVGVKIYYEELLVSAQIDDQTLYDTRAKSVMTVVVPEKPVSGSTIIVVLYSNAIGNITLSIAGENNMFDLVNGITNVTVPDIVSGNYSYVISYTGDDKYAPSVKKGNLTVEPRPIDDKDIFIPSLDGAVGKNVTVQLPDDATGTIILSIGGKDYEFNVVNGTANVTVPELVTGGYNYIIAYSGDSKYASFIKTGSLTVEPQIIDDEDMDIPSLDGATGEVVTVKLPSDAAGIITLSINNKDYLSAVVNGVANVTVPELVIGEYSYNISYSGDSKYASFTKTGSLTVEPQIIDDKDIDISLLDEATGESVTVKLPSDVTGTVILSIGGKDYKSNVVNGVANFKVPSLAIGGYTYVITYSGDSKYASFIKTGSLTVEPRIIDDEDIDIPSLDGVTGKSVTVKLPSDASGIITLSINNKDYLFAVVNGVANVTVPDIVSGNYSYNISYSGDSKYASFTKTGSLTVEPRPIDDKDIIIPPLDGAVGKDVTVQLPGDATGTIILSIGAKDYKFDVVNGTANVKVPDLANGGYTYVITYSGDGRYSSFIKTGSLTVNKVTPAPTPAKTVTKLTLKKVKVKKSAKKLAITATLKINGKAVKGKVIKFKFNKKSYKAKTNKKGVAKITVKKAVLKKLKVGKKVTYTATYGKITKKVTVKVKK